MKLLLLFLLLLWAVFLSSAGLKESDYTSDWDQTLKTIKDGIQNLYTYYRSYTLLKYALELTSGSDQVCQYHCAYNGQRPFPRPGYRSSPNGCGTQQIPFDIKIPAITNCCNEHDHCYDTCGQEKRDCDEQFQICLKNICRNLLNVLGLDQKVQACESGLNLVFNAVMHLGCKPYLESQRAACVCRYRDQTGL